MCREASAALSAATIAALEAQKIDYIPGARERSINEVRETVLHDDGATVPLTIPRQKGETHLAVEDVKIRAAGISSAAMTKRRARTPKPAPSCRRVCNANWPPAPRALWPTPATAASWPHPKPMGSPSTRRRSRRMYSSMVSSCYAPACRCRPWRWCCATGACYLPSGVCLKCLAY